MKLTPRKTILRGCLILQPGGDPAVMNEADICIRGRELVAVGTLGQPFASQDADEVVDLAGRVVMPGLINVHTHTPLTFLRGVAQDVGLSDFFSVMAPHGHLISREHAFWTTLLAVTEMIRNGVTTFVDMFEWMDEAGRAVQKSGIGGGLACEFAGVAPAPKGARGNGFSLSNLRMILDDGYGRRRLQQAEAEIAAIRALGCDRLYPFLG